MGDVSPSGSDHAIEVVSFADDSVASAGNVLMRFIDTAPGLPAMDFGEGTLASTFTPLLTNVSFSSAGATAAADAGTLDTNDYLTWSLRSRPPGSACTPRSADRATPPPPRTSPSRRGGITMALVNGKTGGAASQLLLCTDNAGPDDRRARGVLDRLALST